MFFYYYYFHGFIFITVFFQGHDTLSKYTTLNNKEVSTHIFQVDILLSFHDVCHVLYTSLFFLSFFNLQGLFTIEYISLTEGLEFQK